MKQLVKIAKIGVFGLASFVLFSCGNAKTTSNLAPDNKITLEYNLKQGDTLKQNIATEMDMSQKIMDQEIKINMKMNMKMNFYVKDRQDDRYTLEMKYKEMKIDAGIPGQGNTSFSSNTPEDIATQTDFGPMLKAIIDKPVETVMDKRGKLISTKGFDKLKEAMINSIDVNMPEEMKKMVTGQFGAQISEESLKSMFEQNAGFFPDKPVEVNDVWENNITMQTSSFGLNISMKLTLKSIENNVVTLDMDGTVATPEGAEQDMNGIKAKMSLSGTQKGLLKINKDTGWVISSEILQDLSGTIEAMGMKIPLSSTAKTTVTND
jgi:hypothetical protein